MKMQRLVIFFLKSKDKHTKDKKFVKLAIIVVIQGNSKVLRIAYVI